MDATDLEHLEQCDAEIRRAILRARQSGVSLALILERIRAFAALADLHDLGPGGSDRRN